MRLFVAIDFSPKEKLVFSENAALMKRNGITGNFSRNDNYHITLAFLGEIDKSRLGAVKNALNSVEFLPVNVSVSGITCFKDILVQKVDRNPELDKLASTIRGALENGGIGFDRKPFKAHMTVAREVHIPGNIKFDDLSKELKTCNAIKDEVVLFESTRIEGRLTYRRIYAKKAIAPVSCEQR